MRSRRSHTLARLVGSAAVIACLFALAAPAASASSGQAAPPTTCDPTYGCQPPPTNPPPPGCKLSIHIGFDGIDITLTCTAPTGTPVDVMLNGKQVFSGVTKAIPGSAKPSAAAQPVVFDRPAASPAATASAPLSMVRFKTASLPKGTYHVVVSGSTFNAPAGHFTVTDAAHRSSGGGSSLYSGLGVALWIVVAGAILAAGYVTLRYGRRPRHA